MSKSVTSQKFVLNDAQLAHALDSNFVAFHVATKMQSPFEFSLGSNFNQFDSLKISKNKSGKLEIKFKDSFTGELSKSYNPGERDFGKILEGIASDMGVILDTPSSSKKPWGNTVIARQSPPIKPIRSLRTVDSTPPVGYSLLVKEDECLFRATPKTKSS